MAKRYAIGNPPPVENPELRTVVEWVLGELGNIAATQAPNDIQLNITNVAPSRPQVGEQRYADGTNWNPGGGAGMYEYTGGGTNGWRMLSSGTQY